MGFETNYDWQKKYIEPIKRIVGPLLLEESSLEIDRTEATDLLVLNARDMRIGCRMRRMGYAEKYPWDFTLRAKLQNGAKTELSKITDGWGDWLFYGHAVDDNIASISRWFVIDLHKWRAGMIRDGLQANRKIKWARRNNSDGSEFLSFDIRSFNPSILVSSSHVLEQAHATL